MVVGANAWIPNEVTQRRALMKEQQWLLPKMPTVVPRTWDGMKAHGKELLPRRRGDEPGSPI